MAHETDLAIDPVVTLGDEQYMRDGGGRLVPIDLVKPQHKLEDQTVRTIVRHGQELSARMGRYRGRSFDDVLSFVDVLSEKYGEKRGGKKGNTTLTAYDGLSRVIVQVQDQLSFGPELQIAKGLVDECITNWSSGARSEIRALVEHAFQVDKEGQINRAALFQLRRLDIDDAQWRAAMTALGDAIRVIGSRQYLRVQVRNSPRDRWTTIPLDLATV
ncbi:MAG: sulfate transporter [Sphingomonas hengshuiensis]|nr:MAG: sulfate transporter [Sphingomonas hengshuiensis]